MTSPFFSIITASYNSESTIRDNVRSVASQSCSDFEHLIIDNQSQDKTLSICKSVYEELSSPEKLKLISEPDKGISDAFNKGVKNACGRYVLILSSDDYLGSPSILEIVKNILEETNADLLHGDIMFLDEIYGSNVRQPLQCPIHIAMPFNHQTMFLKAELYEQFGLFDLNLKLAMDYEHTARFYQQPFASTLDIFYLHHVLTIVRGAGASWIFERKALREVEVFLRAKGFYSLRSRIAMLGRIFRVRLKGLFHPLGLAPVVHFWRGTKWKERVGNRFKPK